VTKKGRKEKRAEGKEEFGGRRKSLHRRVGGEGLRGKRPRGEGKKLKVFARQERGKREGSER